MLSINNFNELSFLVYGLGLSGKSTIKFFKKNNIKNYKVWDDKIKNLYSSNRSKNLEKTFKEVDFIVLSPGISLKKSKNKKKLVKYKHKIITDLDLVFLLNKFFKTIVVTGSNGKSTTCKILHHLLKKNNFKVQLGGNIGTPILDLDIKSEDYLIIEASSFQLSHSKFICPDYGVLLNISNDHLDWHGNIHHYIDSKFKLFKFQKKKQFAIVNKNLKNQYKLKNLSGTLVIPSIKKYKQIKNKIKNSYLNSDINDENMTNIFELSKLLKITKKSFIKSLKSFVGLPHRYEIFLKKKNCTFINDSKATSFQATKFALANTKDIFWIVGGLPKKNDKIDLKNIKKNIVQAYIIGKNIKFFKTQLKKRIKFKVVWNIKNSVNQVLKDIKVLKKEKNTILFSPASASYDQFPNFEKRGDKFKALSKIYARKFI